MCADGFLAERLAIVDFCDAAGEWGSTVPIPAREAGRMVELAYQRRVAVLTERPAGREERHPLLETVRPIPDVSRSVDDDRRYCEVSRYRSKWTHALLTLVGTSPMIPVELQNLVNYVDVDIDL